MHMDEWMVSCDNPLVVLGHDIWCVPKQQTWRFPFGHGGTPKSSKSWMTMTYNSFETILGDSPFSETHMHVCAYIYIYIYTRI